MLEAKLDRLGMILDLKMDKEEFRCQIIKIEKRCEKKEGEMQKMCDNIEEKCDEVKFLRHAHTEQGQIILQ